MKFITLRELKVNPSKVLDNLGKEDAVVTRGGKPAAALIYLDEDLLDDFVLAHHLTFLKEVEAARAEFQEKGGIYQESMKRRIE